MKLSIIVPLILTYNEEPNIARTLDKLKWAKKVMVLDSFSTDRTEEIVRGYPNVVFEQRKFDDHATQWNHGVSLISEPWILALDADYVLGDGFEEELRSLNLDSSVDAYIASFRYVIYGKPIHASLYPPRVVLFRQANCRFEKDGHTQILHAPGETARLQTAIDHDDRKSLTRWIVSQDKYAVLEADKLIASRFWSLPMQDRVRRTMLLGPVVVFFYTLIIRRTLFDGWRGWFYAYQRALAELMLSLRLIEKKINSHW